MKAKALKTQISIFVIISVVIVLGLLFLFFFTNNDVKWFENEKSSYIIKEFVEGCIELEAKKGIDQIAMKGGWLYHPDMLFTDRDKPNEFNRVAQGLDILERNKNPYWFYFDDSAEVFVLNIPEYETESPYSIRNQLKRYIDENLDKNCLEGFKAFDGIYRINYEPKEINSKILFNDDMIDVSLDLPIEIVELNPGSSEYIDTFSSEVENKLKIPYFLARDITLAEYQSSFIEMRMVNFLNAYQNSDPDLRDISLPPFYDFRMIYDFKPWDLRRVSEDIKMIFNSNIGLIQFLNTDYNTYSLPDELKDNKFANALYNVYTKDYLSEHSDALVNYPDVFEKYSEYRVTPIYENFFPTYINIGPSSGNVILLPRPEAVINLLPFFFTEYVAVYEITAPVMFSIEANNFDNMEFNFAIETNIDYNTPKAQNLDYGLQLETIDLEEEKSLVCDPVQFISDYITLNISDPLVNGKRMYDSKKEQFNMFETGVEDAVITFDCKGISKCYVGQTSVNGKTISDNITQLKFRLPINCNPGTLEVYKFGHKRLKFDNLDPSLNEPIELGKHYMPTPKTMNVSVSIKGVGANKYSNGKSFSDNDIGFIIFEYLEGEEFVQVLEINEDNQYNLTIDLMPGNYSVSGFILYNDSFTIPSEEICYKKGLFSGEDCETLPALNMDAWVRGGIEVEKFEVTIQKLVNPDVYDELYITFVDFGVPRSYSELEENSDGMGDLKKASESHEPYFD